MFAARMHTATSPHSSSTVYREWRRRRGRAGGYYKVVAACYCVHKNSQQQCVDALRGWRIRRRSSCGFGPIRQCLRRANTQDFTLNVRCGLERSGRPVGNLQRRARMSWSRKRARTTDGSLRIHYDAVSYPWRAASRDGEQRRQISQYCTYNIPICSCGMCV